MQLLIGLTLSTILGALVVAFLLSQTSQVSARIHSVTLTELSTTLNNSVDTPGNYRLTIAATGSDVAATFAVTGAGTAITALALTSLTPQITSTLTITVGDADGLGDTEEIKFILRFDPGDSDFSDADFVTAATSGTAVANKAVFTWTKASPFSASSFVITDPASGASTWSVSSTTNPASGSATGDFVLEFIPGQVAAFGVGGSGFDGWDCYVEVTDSNSTDVASSNTGVGPTACADKSMGAFASISVSPASVSFGPVTSGSSGNAVIDPVNGLFAATTISNKTHALTIKSSATWTDGSTTLTLDEDGSPGVDALSLRADDDATIADAQFLTATAADVTDHSTDARDTTEAGTATDIGLFLDLGTVSPSVGAFSGTVTTGVVN